jgi:hypothetical protein
LTVNTVGNLRVLLSDLTPYSSFYPCFCSFSLSILDDGKKVAIFDLCSCYEVVVVDGTYYDNRLYLLFNLHKV